MINKILIYSSINKKYHHSLKERHKISKTILCEVCKFCVFLYYVAKIDTIFQIFVSNLAVQYKN